MKSTIVCLHISQSRIYTLRGTQHFLAYVVFAERLNATSVGRSPGEEKREARASFLSPII